MYEPDPKSISLRIARIVRESGLNQSQLAAFLKITQPAVSKYLRERIPPPGVLYDLAQLGKTSMEWILTGLNARTVKAAAEPSDTYGAASLEERVSVLPALIRRQLEALIDALGEEFADQGKSKVSSSADRANSR